MIVTSSSRYSDTRNPKHRFFSDPKVSVSNASMRPAALRSAVRTLCAAAFVAFGFSLFAGQALAELRICNDTREVQAFSIGYKGETDWTSEGWWVVDPGDCVTPVGGDLKKRYYYYRAEVDGGDFVGEKYFFCTTPKAYTIVGDQDCDTRGYDKESFSEIDTGTSSKSFTFRMTQQIAAEMQQETGLKFCNETRHVQAVSVGYEGDNDWVSEGWWNIDPGECKMTLRGPLKKRYYYYRAEVNAGEFDGQNYYFCTSPQEYTIVGDKDCRKRGYDREAFVEIDTGKTSKRYTLTLVP